MAKESLVTEVQSVQGFMIPAVPQDEKKSPQKTFRIGLPMVNRFDQWARRNGIDPGPAWFFAAWHVWTKMTPAQRSEAANTAFDWRERGCPLDPSTDTVSSSVPPPREAKADADSEKRKPASARKSPR